MSTLGDNLRRFRGTLSQAEFSVKLGLKNQQTYQRYENGTREPRARVLGHIAEVLHTTVSHLLGDQEPEALPSIQKQHFSADAKEQEVLSFISARIHQFRHDNAAGREDAIKEIVSELLSYSAYCEVHSAPIREHVQQIMRSARAKEGARNTNG